MNSSNTTASRTAFWLRVLLVILAAMVWAVTAISIDMWRGDFMLIRMWSEIPEIMRARVPGYLAAVVVGPVVSVSVLLLFLRNPKFVPGSLGLLFAVGCVWASFTLLVIQLNEAAGELPYEITVDGVSVAGITVQLGWVLVIASILMMLRRNTRSWS